MDFKLRPFELKHRHFPSKKGVLLEGANGNWSEVSPLPGRSAETLEEAISQLTAVQRGYLGPFFPSVAFGLYGLTAPSVQSIPCALLLSGSPDTVLKASQRSFGCTHVKIKVDTWSLLEALQVLPILSSRFLLRIDFNHAWQPSDVHTLCAHLTPDRIDFLEDPGCDVAPFKALYDTHSSTIGVWKPMVRGLPPPKSPLILSSAFESSIGLHHIASLLQSHAISSHVLGLGTTTYQENDVVQNSAYLKGGRLHFPKSWKVMI